MMLQNLLRKATTRLRELPGGVYVGDRIRKQFGQIRSVAEIRDFDDDLTMFLDLGEHMQSQIYWQGSYSRNILFLLDSLLKPGMTFVDGGANIGEISLFAAKRVGSAGHVASFEPMDRFADQLERNRKANNLENVKIYRAGLSNAPGEAIIYLAEERYTDGTQHDGLGTLFKSSTRSKAAASIPLITLDQIAASAAWKRVDFIKLDVEGGELAALQGATALLEERRPGLIIEVGEETCRAAGYEMNDIFEFLGKFGYSFHVIGRRGRLSRLRLEELKNFQNVLCVSS